MVVADNFFFLLMMASFAVKLGSFGEKNLLN